MILKKKVNIVFEKKCIVVYLNNKVFLKQPYIKKYNKNYTFFLVVLILSRFGLVSLQND